MLEAALWGCLHEWRRSIILCRNDQPNSTTLQAWLNSPINDSSSFQQQTFLLPFSYWSLVSFSSRSLSFWAVVATSMPKKWSDPLVCGVPAVCWGCAHFQCLTLIWMLSQAGIKHSRHYLCRLLKFWLQTGEHGIFPFRLTACSGQSSGCTGMIQYADSTLTIALSDSRHSQEAMPAILSTGNRAQVQCHHWHWHLLDRKGLWWASTYPKCGLWVSPKAVPVCSAACWSERAQYLMLSKFLLQVVLD